MYYGFYYKLILKRYINEFNKNIINYFSGRYLESEFKSYRLKFGIYRQKKSYMWRVGVPFGRISYLQLLVLSYISLKEDKKYFHFTTRTNIQFNWIKLIQIFEIFKKIYFCFLHSLQTSGNCVRNITSSTDSQNLKSEVWGEIVRQWFNSSSEFLFLPRKFKISILTEKKDNIIFKTHDLGIHFKKNKFNNIVFNVLIGGGLGRTPIIGVYILRDLHWKNVINYIDKILRIYNVYGFRKNIYKARLKILIKSLNKNNFAYFLYREFNFSNYYIYTLNEKEINYFLNNDYLYNFKKKSFSKKIMFNPFFLNWFKNSYFNNFVYLPLKNLNKAPGDLNYLQLKLLYFFFKYFKHLKIFNRQNLIFINFNSAYFLYLKLKKIFLNIFNFNKITDIICCPGKNYCVLANAQSIIIANIIQSIFKNFKSIYKIKNLFLNISGCVNSCGHHHVANIGILGVDKNNEDHYQIYTGGNFNNYDSLIFSKVLFNSFIYFKISYFLIKILKIFLINENKKNFINFYYNYEEYFNKINVK